jgi:hypothetical protein
MALALMFLNGEAVMAFRSLRAYPRHLVKLLHAVLHGSAVLVIAVGIKVSNFGFKLLKAILYGNHCVSNI